MNSRSWMLIEQQNPAWTLPEDLSALDPFQARDCGWVEQMLPFIEQYSKPNELVVDPFCGFASTLVASHLTNRQGLGYEICQQRIAISKERLTRLNAFSQQIIGNDILENPPKQPIDLCLTNVPYFGCQWTSDNSPNQCYQANYYQQYLEMLTERFKLISNCLKSDRFCIVMAENIRLDNQVIPQAWDIAKTISQYLHLCEERILLYKKPTQSIAKFTTQTDRSHEYALIFQKKTKPLAIDEAINLLKTMQEHKLNFVIYGSFANYLHNKNHTKPADIDLLINPDNKTLNQILAWLENHGFKLQSWQNDIKLPIDIKDYQNRYYFRAQSIDKKGEQITLDLTFHHQSIDITAQLNNPLFIDGLPTINSYLINNKN